MVISVAQLTAQLGALSSSTAPVRHLVLDSRKVDANTGFVAVPGQSSDGRRYFANALDQGAPVVFYESEGADHFYTPEALQTLRKENPNAALVPVANLRARLGLLAKVLYPIEQGNLQIGAVTGTNGKTTVSTWVAGACHDRHAPVGLSGTLGIGLFGSLQFSENTTPDVLTLFRFFAELVKAGGKVAMMEASSHALAQDRLQGLPINTAVWTQLSQDHLDYHGTMAAYAAEKLKLLQWPGLSSCVLNLGDATARQAYLTKNFNGEAITYCVEAPGAEHPSDDLVADYRVVRIDYDVSGLRLELITPGGPFVWRLPFWGAHNAENALAAALCLVSFGWDFEAAAHAVANQPLPPGRLERFHQEGQPAVIVDYAHTPDALSHLLVSVRRHCRGKLWVVFGCGGDRDQAKRPQMGAIAERLADQVVLTNDNPRYESAEQIVEGIQAGMSTGVAVCELDRAKAVSLALQNAQPEDVIVVAGKGHENYQEIAGERLPFCDRLLVRQLLGLETKEPVSI